MEYNWLYTFCSAIADHIMVPIIAALGVALLMIIKNRFDKIAKAVVAKNEIEDLQKQNSIRKDLIESLDTIVQAAVATNMQLVNAIKSEGRKLTDEEVKQLNDSCHELVMASLPPSVTEEGGVLLEVIGGKDKLNALINSLMEKHVYEYKINPNAADQRKKAADENPDKEKKNYFGGLLL